MSQLDCFKIIKKLHSNFLCWHPASSFLLFFLSSTHMFLLNSLLLLHIRPAAQIFFHFPSGRFRSLSSWGEFSHSQSRSFSDLIYSIWFWKSKKNPAVAKIGTGDLQSRSTTPLPNHTEIVTFWFYVGKGDFILLAKAVRWQCYFVDYPSPASHLLIFGECWPKVTLYFNVTKFKAIF